MPAKLKWFIVHRYNGDVEAWLVYKDATLGIYPRRSRTSVSTFERQFGTPYCIVREKHPPAFKNRGVH